MGHQEAYDFRCTNITTATINCNKNHYKQCTYCNDGDGAWGYHWKVDHREWKGKQVNNKLVQFSDSATNEVIYCSYLMATSENCVKE